MSRKELKALGSKRESLSTNPLLIRPQTGTIRRRCITLPSSDFTYGIQNERTDGGVAEVMVWNEHHSKVISKKPEKDFLSLNKLSVQSGLTNALEQTQFRKTHDIRKKEEPVRGPRVRTPPPDISFGITTRPSTPIFDLLCHRYQEAWLEEMRKKEDKMRKEMREKRLNGKVYETRASLLRRFSEPVDPPPLWKMSRFSKIPARLETFRSESERTAAFINHASDATSRAGVFGHGIYQAAQS